GLKGGISLTDNLMLEGNAAWWNQFNFKNYDYRTHAILYEVGGTYNFYQVRVRGVVPYLSLGVGGLTMNVMNRPNFNDHDAAVYAVPKPANQPQTTPFASSVEPLVIRTGDTFFNFSYGGGLKAQRLWGPLGLR